MINLNDFKDLMRNLFTIRNLYQRLSMTIKF